MLTRISTVRTLAPWICLGVLHAAACSHKDDAEGASASSGAITTDTIMGGGTTHDPEVRAWRPGGPDGCPGPDGSTESSGTPPMTTGPTITAGTTSSDGEGTSTAASVTDATGTDTGESSGISSGGELPMECGT